MIVSLNRKKIVTLRFATIMVAILAIIGFAGWTILARVAPQADATASAANWRAGNIINDGVFYNNNSMSVQEIQSFLNQKVTNCDTDGTQRYNSSMTNAQFAATQGWPGPKYVCLKDYYQVPRSDQNINNLTSNVIPDGAISAAAIIKNAADTYGVSPKVLLVTLQKESLNLLNDNWPLPSQYRNAMGYGCPDTAPCDPQYEGFYNQMTNAARQFKLYRNNPSGYRYKAQQYNTISYQANAPSCGSTSVFIDTTATAGLYNYTPYQPNQAALNNLYGTGDSCSAYGNRNFWRTFVDWFGSVDGNQFEWSQQNVHFYYDAAKSTLADPSHLQPDSRVLVNLTATNLGWATWANHGPNPIRIGTSQPEERASGVCDFTWISCQRPAQLTNYSVVPGADGTFDFWIKTSKIPGAHTETFNLLSEGLSWMKGAQLNVTYVVDATYQWAPVTNKTYLDSTKSQEIDGSSVPAGVRTYHVMTVRNTGSTTWQNSGDTPITLAPNGPNERRSGFCDPTWINCTRIVTSNESSTAPNAVATFEYWTTAPSRTGSYAENYNFVVENVTWLNDLGAHNDTNVVPATYTWEPVSKQIYTTGNVAINSHYRPSTTYKLVVTAKNTGNTYWKKGVTNIATASPRDRNSALYNSTWLSNSRAATLNEDSVAPGSNGTFTVSITTPAQFSVIHEEFNLIAEGITWMPEKGMYIDMSVANLDYSWQYTGQYQYTDATGARAADMQNLRPSTGYFFIIKAKNVGSEDWTKNSVLIGTARPNNRTSVLQHPTWPTSNRAGTLFETTVKPGEIGTFGFWVLTPATTGSYSEGFEAVIDNVTWFNELGINYNFTVK